MNARALAIIALALSACSRDTPATDQDAAAPPVLAFDTVPVRLITPRDTIELRAELARSMEQKQLGLMERRSLPGRAGMLFLYDSTQPPTSAFWMYRTRIPLDIAYIDSAGVIRSIVSMVPCTSDVADACPNYPSGAPFRAALEVNAGFFRRNGITTGHRVVFADSQPARSR